MFLHLPFKRNKKCKKEILKLKKYARFHLLHHEERGHLLAICEPLLVQSCTPLLGCLLQNRVGKADPHILLAECAEHTFLISGERTNVH
jgi:hypothetical protein